MRLGLILSLSKDEAKTSGLPLAPDPQIKSLVTPGPEKRVVAPALRLISF